MFDPRVVVFGVMMMAGAVLLLCAWHKQLRQLCRLLFVPTGRATRWDLFRAMFYSVLIGYGWTILVVWPNPMLLLISTVAVVLVCGSTMGLILLFDPEIRAFRDRIWK